MRIWHAAMVLALALCTLGAAGPATYTDPVYGFSMSSPSFSQTKQDRVDVVVFQAPPEDNFAANITVTVDPVKTTRDDYVKNSLEAMKATNPRANMRSIKLLEVSGKDAESLDYDASMAGRRLRFLQLVVVAADRVYIVTCTAPVESFATYQAQFQKCVDSFHLDN